VRERGQDVLLSTSRATVPFLAYQPSTRLGRKPRVECPDPYLGYGAEAVTHRYTSDRIIASGIPSRSTGA